MKGIQDTSSKTFRQLLGNGLTYEVPKFQRDYSWDVEQLEDIWQDLQEALAPSAEDHYMGYLVLQTNDSRKYTVIDGQQRLTTMSIIILAALNNLSRLEALKIDAENNKKRREVIHSGFIGQIDYKTLVAYNKLTLSRHNNSFYKDYLVPMTNIPLRGLNSSEKLMKNCFDYFSKKIEADYGQTGEDIAHFVENMVDKFFFTVITVNDELNAFKVFETLNARGVRLSSTDLVKNYLLSLLEKDNGTASIERAESLWEDVINTLKEEKFPEFLRYYWNGRRNLTRKDDLFKAIKREIINKEDVMTFMSNIRFSADIYKALQDPEDEFWRDKKWGSHSEEIKRYLGELKLFEVKQPYPLLMVTNEKCNETDFLRILKICSVITFRYNVIGEGNPSEQEKIYNRVALKIARNEPWSKEDFTNIYPSDEKFENDFSYKSFYINQRTKSKIRYILSRLELQKNGHSIDESIMTVEHILPQNPEKWGAWGFSEEIAERYIGRLANLTLLETNLNKEAGDKSFAEKKKIYTESNVLWTQELNNFEDWSEMQIRSRQKEMAKMAKTVWSIQ